jgi:hypothetical protein
VLYIVYTHLHIYNMCKIRKYMDIRTCIRILYVFVLFVSVRARRDVGQRWRPTKFHDLFAVSGKVLTHFCRGKRAGSSCPDQVHHFSDSLGFLFQIFLGCFFGTYALHWIERAEFWVAKVARKEGNTDRERERERDVLRFDGEHFASFLKEIWKWVLPGFPSFSDTLLYSFCS